MSRTKPNGPPRPHSEPRPGLANGWSPGNLMEPGEPVASEALSRRWRGLAGKKLLLFGLPCFAHVYVRSAGTWFLPDSLVGWNLVGRRTATAPAATRRPRESVRMRGGLMAVRIKCELREPGAELRWCDYIEFEWSTTADAAVGNALRALAERLRESGKKLSADDENALRNGLRLWLAEHRQEICNGEALRQNRLFLYACLKPLKSLEEPKAVVHSLPVSGTRPHRPSAQDSQRSIRKETGRG